MDYYLIGQKIRKYRKAQSLSQEALAEKIGISTTHMSHIETGNTKLSLSVLVQLATVLNVSTDDILFDRPSASENVLTDMLVNMLEGCDAQKLSIIIDVVQSLQSSLQKHL